MYSGGSGLSIDIHFVDIELSYDVLSPLPTLLSKHFNHPHPYIEIATAISDKEDLIIIMLFHFLHVEVHRSMTNGNYTTAKLQCQSHTVCYEIDRSRTTSV